jgi:Protein of unknown function (DUF664)
MEIVADDFLYFMNRALDGMVRVAEELGDERVNLRPDLPGTNSPYVILYHAVCSTHFWCGAILAGRRVTRDRDAEFQATGTVADLRKAVEDLQQQLPKDLEHVQGDRPLIHPDGLLPIHVQHGVRDWSQGKALIHAYEELAQHFGQLEITRDILMRAHK